MIQEGKRGGKRGKEKVWEIEDTKKNGKIIPKYMSHHKNVKATNGRVENICKPYIQKGQISRIYKKQVISKSKTEFLKSGQRPG